MTQEGENDSPLLPTHSYGAFVLLLVSSLAYAAVAQSPVQRSPSKKRRPFSGGAGAGSAGVGRRRRSLCLLIIIVFCIRTVYKSIWKRGRREKRRCPPVGPLPHDRLYFLIISMSDSSGSGDWQVV